MTISGSGFNINFNPQPSIYEKETMGQIAQKNTAEVRGNVAIIPQSQSDNISFTKIDDRNKWDYKAEPERPSLAPNTILRGSGADIRNLDDNTKLQYEKLFDQLPDDLKLQLAGLPTVYTAALKFVLDLAANALDWQEKAELKSQTENALNRAESNRTFPDRSYVKSLEIGSELAARIDNWVEEIGKNEPGYTEAKEFLEDAKNLLKETKHDIDSN